MVVDTSWINKPRRPALWPLDGVAVLAKLALWSKRVDIALFIWYT